MLRFALTVCLPFAVLVAATCSLVGQLAAADPPARPNVILIMTDDQGYGDLSCHGNPILKTPRLDELAAQSTRLTNFHVDPTCAETRSALMTGRYSARAGVWHTIAGRSWLRREERVLPEYFAAAGYATGIFGKWHLGDNYPLRAVDRGWQESLVLGGGGVGQVPDFWGNDYFDDTYWHNGQPAKQEGYCTDVFFGHATQFIARHREQPFFCYIATNAPHSPYNVDKKYAQPYLDAGVPQPRANFYGMIANIDENVGRLLGKLEEWKLAEKTLVIFMTDNGTAAGWSPQAKSAAQRGFNAGMRANKGSHYEGGHRVPCFLRWPGQLPANREVATLAAHFDLLPTLIDLCRLKSFPQVKFDGASLAPLLKPSDAAGRFPARHLVVHSQRREMPEKWHKTTVMTDRWRLVDGQELYDLEADPGQKQNVASQHSDVVRELTGAYDRWWAEVSPGFKDLVRIDLAPDNESPQRLTGHDWHPEVGNLPVYQDSIGRGVVGNGWWAVNIPQPGRYEFRLRRWPAEVDSPLGATSARVAVRGPGEASHATGGAVAPGAREATLILDLPAGPAALQTWLEGDDGQTRGAYFVYVRRIEKK